MEEIKQLWQRIPALPSNIKHVQAVDKMIEGTAFFPGGMGLYPGGSDYIHQLPKPIMVLGHDFDSVTGYKASLGNDTEDMEGPTWSNLLGLLKDADLNPSACYFTNFYMGVRLQERSTGKHPGRTNREFVEACSNFLREQLRVVKPSLLLVLGTHVPPLLAEMAPGQLGVWRKASSTAIYNAGNALVKDIDFGEGVSVRAAVSLTHPCMRKANLWRRGGSLEIGLLNEKDLITQAGIYCGILGNANEAT